MGDLGVFGGTVAEETDECNDGNAEGSDGGFGGGMGAEVRAGGAMSAPIDWQKATAKPFDEDGACRRRRRWPRQAPIESGACGRRRRSARARAGRAAGGPPGPADAAHQVRRHGPLGRHPHHRQQRHGRGRAGHARKPHHLADQGLGHGPRHPVGQGQTDVVTRKDLIIRLEAPRFFVQTDEVVLSAIVHNYLKTKKSVQVVLELGGKTLQSTRRS